MSASASLRQVSWLSRADAASIEQLAARCVRRELRRGELLFSQGSPSEHLFVIVEGTIAAVKARAGGEELILRAARPFETPGSVDLTAGRTHDVSARALTDAVVLELGNADIRAVIEREPSVAMALIEELSDMVRVLGEAVVDATSQQLPQRLARLLLATFAEEAPPLTQGDLARHLGVARQSVNRSLGALTRDGLVVLSPRGAVAAVDREALARFAEGSASGSELSRVPPLQRPARRRP